MPLDAWRPTKNTLHLYLQIVGKIRLRTHPFVNHWWHVPLYVSPRGLTTRNIPRTGGSFEIEEVSLTIPMGARIGISGPTGSGKSTLVDLLMGLLEPTSGVIRIDGVELGADIRWAWQAQIAHVPQSIFLADDTIAANIAFGQPNLDRERMTAAAEAAQLTDFVHSLPHGFETLVGERGIRLSGGQRQRIGIARALYKGAPLLILDEATSALDRTTEAAVLDAVMAIDERPTIVVIAHAPSTLSKCERIIRLEQGRVVSGNR